MPVIGTPVTSSSVILVNTSYPVLTELYGAPLYGKMRAAASKQSQYTKLQIQLIDPYNFAPVDLTGYGYISGAAPQGPQGDSGAVSWIKFRFMESAGLCGIADDAENQTIEDAANGIISCIVPDLITANAGVYTCEAGMFDAYNRFLFSNTFYFFVERGLFTTGNTQNPGSSGVVGPPTLQEIRISLRDVGNSNRLIDTEEFDLADICDATVRSVLMWNHSQPPIDIFYSTITFPYRYQWLDGISAHLFESAATFYRRNNLKHDAGGLSIADLDREKEYMQAWQIRYQKYSDWVRAKKVQINMDACWGTYGSPYSTSYYSSGSASW